MKENPAFPAWGADLPVLQEETHAIWLRGRDMYGNEYRQTMWWK